LGPWIVAKLSLTGKVSFSTRHRAHFIYFTLPAELMQTVISISFPPSYGQFNGCMRFQQKLSR
jgi:hypothetical protein